MKKYLLTALACAAAISTYGCSKPAEIPTSAETIETVSSEMEAVEETTEAADMTVGTVEETASAADEEVSTASGIVVDATMNALTIQIAGEGVFSLSTANVEERELSEGLLIGSPVTISYTGELENAVVTRLADSQEKPVLPSDRLMFAANIISAVQGRDLERLASLANYPVYVGLGDGMAIASAKELEALDPEEVFTEQLVKSVTTVDLLAAEEAEAGVVLSDGSVFNIIFTAGETGILGITGINYGE